MSVESFKQDPTYDQVRDMKSNLQSDEVVTDFINFLARLSLSEPIAYSWGPPIARIRTRIRRYCTRLGRGGWWDTWVNTYREDEVLSLEVRRDVLKT